MLLDSTIEKTKCAGCIYGRTLVLCEYPEFPCCMCKDRPYRNQDKSYYQEDVKSEWLKEMLDTEAIENSRLDY